ncbi:hypothetical protein [Halomarina oriensis]|uniref:Uncharacterized protein n=1 Tax=Halomarina oriensis TaxID=671145 RepID=A0A6B0GP94_9EURY|nr:hypothetical protein [Halomarina oriensis]MWG34493.1 hypothetical protein [Halomarina oriensis]
MPLDTTEEAWQSAADASTYRDAVRQYLADHTGVAYHDRELADAVMGTSWAERGDGGVTTTDALTDLVHTQFLHDQLDELVRAGHVTARNVPAARLGDEPIPADWDHVTYYACAE